jgi:arachidonate 5-lipoxygenase
MKSLYRRFQLWFWGKFFIFLIAMGSGLRRRRMSHNNGIVGRGKLKIVDAPQFPACEFFEPGREFTIRLRHSSSGYMDDTMTPVRSASIKFTDSRFRSPFDLQMNTGHHCFFWNARSFLEFAFSRDEHEGIEYVKYHTKYGWGRKSAADSQIKNASSFTKLHYHSHTPFGFKAKDGIQRYIRFRLIPGDRSEQDPPFNPEYVKRAEADPGMALEVANQRSPDGETRNCNYMKNDWAERVKAGPVRYILQVQFHVVKPDDSVEILNPLEPWDEATHPYTDLATVEITETLSHEEQDRMAYEISNLPPCMHILPAKSLDDYNSLNYMRWNSIWAIRVRQLMTALFGVQKPIKDDDYDKVRNKKLPGT